MEVAEASMEVAQSEATTEVAQAAHHFTPLVTEMDGPPCHPESTDSQSPQTHGGAEEKDDPHAAMDDSEAHAEVEEEEVTTKTIMEGYRLNRQRQTMSPA